MNIGVVISRYNEDINWSLNIKHKIYLYNKGKDNLSVNNIRLENVGREAQTYLHHIVFNYQCLDEYTVFLQGDPGDHGFYDHFKTIEDFNNAVFTKGFHPFLRKSENFQYITRPGHDFNMVELAEQHGIKLEQKPLYEFVQGAQFAVKKENILSRPKCIYEHLLNTLSAQQGSNSPAAHSMERMWKYLFNG